MFAMPALSVMAQERADASASAAAGDIEALIHRFELRQSDLHGNGWSHYYIPREMGDTLTVKMSCVYKGMQTHAPHTHNEDEAFFVIRGPQLFHINGVERVVETGDFVYTPSLSSHNIARVSESDTIKYLVLKRETKGQVPGPYPFYKADYTFDDCITCPSRFPEWADSQKNAEIPLLKGSYSNGFQIDLLRFVDDEAQLNHDSGQLAIYVVSGEAVVMLGGKQSSLYADNTFYCPKNSTCILKKAGSEPLVFIKLTTGVF